MMGEVYTKSLMARLSNGARASDLPELYDTYNNGEVIDVKCVGYDTQLGLIFFETRGKSGAKRPVYRTSINGFFWQMAMYCCYRIRLDYNSPQLVKELGCVETTS